MGPKANKVAIDGAIAMQQLSAKAKVLRSLQAQAGAILGDGNPRKVKRTQDQLQTKIDESFTLVAEIAELKLLSDENEVDVNKWTSDLEKALEVFEESLEDFEAFFKDEEAKSEKSESRCCCGDEKKIGAGS